MSPIARFRKGAGRPGGSVALATRLLAAGLTLAPPLAPPLGAAGPLPGGRWLEARSEHFVAVGDASERRMRETVANLERIRAHFVDVAPGLAAAPAPPLRVYVARDGRTLEKLLPPGSPGARRIAGQFVDRGTLRFVQVDASGDLGVRDHVVAHEYFHYLARRGGRALPVWLDEGLADFWAATEFGAKGRTVGRLIPYRMEALEGARLLPLERLLAIDRSSGEYRSARMAPLFYAESWGLVHFLALGERRTSGAPDGGSREAAFRAYVDRVVAGADPVAAARDAFGDLAALERDFRAYLGSRLFPLAEMPPLAAPDARAIAVRSLPTGEAAAELAILLSHMGLRERARELAAVAVAETPELPASRLARALGQVFDRRYAAALDDFAAVAAEEVTARDDATPWAPLALYGAAVARLAAGGEGAQARAEADLRRALGADGAFAPAASRLADLLFRRVRTAASGGEPRDAAALGEALALVVRAREARPDDNRLALAEADLRAFAGDAAGATRILDAVVRGALASSNAPYLNNLCWQGALTGHADRFRPLCEAAIALGEPNASHLDSRGLARALTGDLAGARADFAAALDLAEGRWTGEQIAVRRRWIEALDRGRSPFDGAELSRLRDSPDDSPAWGY